MNSVTKLFVRFGVAVTIVIAGRQCTAAQYVIAPVALSGQQAPGVPGAVFGDFAFNVRPALANNGDVVFDGRLLSPFSTSVTAQNDTGIWAGGGSNLLTLAAREDDLAPGAGPNERYDRFGFPNISNVGGVAFNGRLRGPGITSANDVAIWSGPVGSLSLAARAGAQAPGAPAGHVFTDDIRGPHYSDAGHVSFGARIDVPNSNFNRSGQWVGPANSIQKVVIDNDPATTLGAGVVYTGVEIFPVPVNDAGRIVFAATGVLGGVTSANDDGLWTSPAGGPHTLAIREGNPTGISQVNFATTFGEFSSINGAGEIITLVSLTGPGASASTSPSLWAGAPGSLGLIARRGSQAPDSLPGALYDFFPGGAGLARVINDSKDIAFLATLQGAETGRGVWTGNLANSTSALDRVAFEGEQAAGFPNGVNYSALGWVDNGIGINSAGSVLFTGLVSGPGINFNNDRGVWLYEKAWNKVELIVREGQQIQIAPNDIRTVADISIWNGFGQNDGRWESLNDSDQVAFRLGFTDNTSGIFVASKMMVPEPSVLILLSIASLFSCLMRRRAATMWSCSASLP